MARHSFTHRCQSALTGEHAVRFSCSHSKQLPCQLSELFRVYIDMCCTRRNNVGISLCPHVLLELHVCKLSLAVG